jgi:hypothetical protein
MAARASALSKVFKWAHKSLIMFSYRFGYYLKMSFTTITISSTTYWAATLVLMSSWKAKTHLSAASSSFTAIRPTAEIAFRAKTTSISYAYSLNSESNTSIFFKSASLTSSSSFSNLM